MKSSLKKYLIVFVSVACYLLLMKVAIVNKHSPQREISQLESTVARIPLGSSQDETETLMGSPPDATSNSKGVIVNPTMMLAAVNEQIVKYGVPQEYTLHTWKRDDVIATVAFDQTGKVVCRWAWSKSSMRRRSYHPYSPYEILKRVGLF
ncbi:hypothetical protein Pan241w_24220 [Gimesia alba]|uniref:Uncharacterized protein n=1 Tax=Gimesia alba TaxID=2527973 RepID=A0A517REP1_9PLAN|nr:hypothetical protein [Gimesia alba]QDT42339.1 hypothetical protein Pan241w_24220 [Gimesia alba]